MKSKTKITSAILFSTLITIYLTFLLLSFFMILVISLPISEATNFDQMISYIIFSSLIFVCATSLSSCLLILYIENLKWYFKWPAYVCLPISIPLIILTKKKSKTDFFDVKNNFGKKDSILENFFVLFVFILSCLTALGIFLISLLFLLLEIINPSSWMIILFLPIFSFSFSIVFGGIFNIFYSKNPSKTNKKIAWFGLIFTWWFLVYQDFLKKDITF